MREMSHRLVIFLSGTIKKNAGKGPFCRFDVRGVGLCRHEKVAEGRPGARLVLFSEITKKQVSLYA